MKKFVAILAAIMILAMLCGTIVPVAATEEPAIDSSMYDAAAEGDLLYTLNFAGDDIWQPGNILRESSVVPNADDPTKAVFAATEDSARTFWGGPIKGLPLYGEYYYTITFKVTRETVDEETGEIIDSPFGFYIDDGTNLGYGMYGYSYKTALMVTSERIIGDIVFANDGLEMQGVNYRAEGADKTIPCVQEYALEVDCDMTTLKLYMVNSTGAWILMQETEIGDIAAFEGDYLCPSLYNWRAERPVTVENVNIYKGFKFSEKEDTTTVPADTTTVPADTTTVPADTTTVPADTTTVPQGNTTTAPQGNTTTEAPKSNGCGGFAVLPVSIVAILGLAVTVVVKKAI